MKRLFHAAGVAVAAAALCLTTATTANAAHGDLIFSPGLVVENPSGCVEAPLLPLILQNRTNEYAIVYSGPNCTGEALTVVPPGGKTTQEFGSSVFVA
ncbi:hypothetical protein ACFWJ4_41120 [Kitasatospora sp. NPDC127067]|uniref:hypothetical protein n=1 Tax=Kitasatospora sp. NPDC127067 TaxID=3347126 RepID=UPI00364F6395